VTVDTINDPALPELDGLFIGGGFPETSGDALCANTFFRESLRSAIEKEDHDAIKSGSETLERAMSEVASMAYGAGGPPGAGGETPPPGAAGGKKGGDVIDAEFEETN
jgi:hypothetical protein